jgi:F-type H+-transporting ATPase subunit gamma
LNIIVLRKNIIADFPKIDTQIPIENIYPIAKLLTEKYKSGEYKKIVLVYNYFVSTLAQKPKATQLLPFVPEVKTEEESQPIEYVFEPSPKEVLNHLIPRIIESQIYQAVLESDASEHSARMVMMKNATDAAGDLINDLTLTFNQLRQNKITTELSEITAGKIALENK